jgi:Ca-activated chloride channel family protein
MRWDQPWWLLLLAAVPFLIWRARRPMARVAPVLWVRAGRAWSARGSAIPIRIVSALGWLALLLAIVALARPQQGLRQTETESKGVDIVLALDVSPSMSALDFQPRDRLYVAKETAREFVKQRDHDRLGLVAFAGTSFTQCPLTLDHEVMLELLSALDFGMAEDGTAIGMGLATAVARLKESKTPGKVIVLLTDGQNNRGAIDPLTGAELAKTYGIRVYTILVGKGGMVPVPVSDPVFGRRVEMVRMDVDDASLQEIAKRTGGRFFRATDASALANIYSAIDRIERAPVRSIEYRDYHDLGPLLLSIAAVILLFQALSQVTWAVRLP